MKCKKCNEEVYSKGYCFNHGVQGVDGEQQVWYRPKKGGEDDDI